MKKQINLTKEYWINFLKLKRNEFFGLGLFALAIIPGILLNLKMYNWVYVCLGILFIGTNLYLAYVKTYITDYDDRGQYYGCFVIVLSLLIVINLFIWGCWSGGNWNLIIGSGSNVSGMYG